MISCMDAVISTRLHTIIFAAKQRVPVLGVVYDPKVEACLAALQMPDVGTPKNFDRAAALKVWQDFAANRGEYCRRLEESVSRQEQLERDNEDFLQQFVQRL